MAKQEEQHDWEWVQKRFEKLGQPRKQPSGLNIWTCEVTGPRKSRRLHGYLHASPDALFQATAADNPYLRHVHEAAKREERSEERRSGKEWVSECKSGGVANT